MGGRGQKSGKFADMDGPMVLILNDCKKKPPYQCKERNFFIFSKLGSFFTWQINRNIYFKLHKSHHNTTGNNSIMFSKRPSLKIPFY